MKNEIKKNKIKWMFWGFENVKSINQNLNDNKIGNFKNKVFAVLRYLIIYLLILFIDNIGIVNADDPFSYVLQGISMIIAFITYSIFRENYSILNKKLLITLSSFVCFFFVIFLFINYMTGTILIVSLLLACLSLFLIYEVPVAILFFKFKNNKDRFYIQVNNNEKNKLSRKLTFFVITILYITFILLSIGTGIELLHLKDY